MPNALTTALTNTRKVLTKRDVSLLDVIRAIHIDAANELPTPTKVTLPKKVALSEEQNKALASLPDLVADLSLPSTRRALRPAEVAKIMEWTRTAKSAAGAIDNIITQLKVSFFNHADIVAEREGRAVPGETPRDKNGWYLLDDKDTAGVVQGEPTKLTREARVGSVALTVEGIDALIADGVLPMEARDQFVKTVEAVDENAVIAFMASNHEAIPKIASKVTQVSSPSVSFHIRKNE